METKWDWLDSAASGKKWVPYEDQYQDLFNLALKNNNPKSSFSVNGVKYEMDYQKMVQKNLKTNYERPIRMRIENDEDKNADDNEWCYWEWMNDANKWIMYPPEINLELETHYRQYLKDSTKSSFTIPIGDSVKVSYIVDFKKMAQINSKSYFTRNVRRTIASDITNKTEMKKEPEEVEEGPSSNLRKRKSGTSTAASAKSASNLAIKEEIKEEEKSENEPAKKSLKKSKSSASSSSDKRKNEDDEEVPKSSGRGRKKVKKEEKEDDENEDVKEEKKDHDEDEAESKSTSKSRGRKKAAKKDDDENEDKDDEDNEVKEENVKVVAFSGEVPVDEKFLEMVGTDYRIYKENDVIYDCMLNQTNLQFNNNKYYLIQLLESKKTKNYVVWMRWGRVGKVGQFSVEHCGSDLNRAKAAFEHKFHDKTRNNWSEKDTFEKYPGKYDLVVKEYDSPTTAKEFNDELDAALKKTESEESKQPVPDSKLDKNVQQLIELICNVREMESMLKELKYDAKKAPLGKLGKSQIKAGYAALKEIETLIKANDFGSKFIQANNDFYTRIPHDFGMRKPPTIQTMREVREKVKLLELLDDIEVAVKALAQKSDTVNPVDRHYEQLNCELKPLDKNSQGFKLISDYITNTHAPTHNSYKLKVLDVFEAERKGERERFVDHGNRMLLWHGSRITNWAGILTQGLRIAPEEAPVTGYMFGKGVYFSDCCSKSANYCYTTSTKNVGILSLSEVSLGQMHDLKQADYNANKLPAGKHSTRGLGRSAPNPTEWVTLDDGLVVPCGKLKNAFTNSQDGNSCALLYNEYIVYNENQIKLKYIVKVEFVYDDEE